MNLNSETEYALFAHLPFAEFTSGFTCPPRRIIVIRLH
jgi:hypothetical protein